MWKEPYLFIAGKSINYYSRVLVIEIFGGKLQFCITII